MYIENEEEHDLSVLKVDMIKSCLSSIFENSLIHPLDITRKSYNELLSLTPNNSLIEEYKVGVEYIERVLISCHSKGLFGHKVQNISLNYNKDKAEFCVFLDVNLPTNYNSKSISYYLYENAIKESPVQKENIVLYFHESIQENKNIADSLDLSINAGPGVEMKPYSMENDADNIILDGLFADEVKKVEKQQSDNRRLHLKRNIIEVYPVELKKEGLFVLLSLIEFLNSHKKVMLHILNGKKRLSNDISLLLSTVCNSKNMYTLNNLNEDLQLRGGLIAGNISDVNVFLSNLEGILINNNPQINKKRSSNKL